MALVAGGLIFALLAVGVGWFLFLRKQDPAVATNTATATSQPADTMPPAGTAVEPSLPPATTVAQNDPVTQPVPAPPVTAANQPPAQTRTVPAPRTDPGMAAPPQTTAPRPAQEPAPRAQASSDYAFLDEEAPESDGRDAGERLAGTYRQSGGTTSGGTFGASGRFRARERSPRNLSPNERPAVATIRHLIDRMEAYQRKQGRYAGLADLRAAGLALDVPVSGNTFQRRGFRFEVTVESDGFRVTATPLSPSGRSFIGDDSGYIREGVD